MLRNLRVGGAFILWLSILLCSERSVPIGETTDARVESTSDSFGVGIAV